MGTAGTEDLISGTVRLINHGVVFSVATSRFENLTRGHRHEYD
jgi:hypothetical protein